MILLSYHTENLTVSLTETLNSIKTPGELSTIAVENASTFTNFSMDIYNKTTLILMSSYYILHQDKHLPCCVKADPLAAPGTLLLGVTVIW